MADAQTRQAVAFDDRARGLGRNAESFGDLSVGKLFDRHGDQPDRVMKLGFFVVLFEG
jgi:hypothetical protein